VADPQMVGIIGPTCSGAAASAMKVVSEAGLVIISGSSSAPSLTSVGGEPGPDWQPGFLRTAQNDALSGQAAATFAFQVLGVTAAATLNDGDPYTRGLADTFEGAFTDLGGQVVLTKRLSNRWMMNASFTYSDWRRYYEGEYLGTMYDLLYPSMFYGLSNQEYFDGGVMAPESGGSGERYIFSNTRWIFKLSGLYQLPYGFNISGSVNAREGYVNPTYLQVFMPGIGYEDLFGSPDGGGKYGDERLPNFWVINLRLEKVFNISESSTVTLAADVFNLTNSAHVLKQERRIDADNFGQAQQILSPRVFRFGIRFSF